MKFATCSEPWRDQPIEKVFEIAAKVGYAGVEIAPFTIAEHVDDISADHRKRIARAAADAGVEVVGIHWLLASPKGMHITTPDDAIRHKTAEYIKSLARFCGDVGGKVMIHGSPQQRNIEPPNTFEDGWKRARDLFRDVAPVCAERGVTLCVEALGPAETNFINTAEQAARMADEVGHPGVDIMLDMKAMSTMPDGVVGTIRKFGNRARHVHANEACGKGVGIGLGPDEGAPVDLQSALAGLQAVGFAGWVSVEPFNYEPDPTTVAETSLKALQQAAAA